MEILIKLVGVLSPNGKRAKRQTFLDIIQIKISLDKKTKITNSKKLIKNSLKINRKKNKQKRIFFFKKNLEKIKKIKNS